MLYYRLQLIFLHPKIYTLFFFPFLKIFKLEFLIQDLISQVIVNENEIPIYQNLSLGVDNQKQIKFWKVKMAPLFNGLLNTLCFFTHPVYEMVNWTSPDIYEMVNWTELDSCGLEHKQDFSNVTRTLVYTKAAGQVGQARTLLVLWTAFLSRNLHFKRGSRV